MPVPANLILLRGLIPELPMRPGDLLPARVYSRGTLVLAGVRVAAQLPENLENGQRLRVRAGLALPLPGGQVARLFVDRDGGSEGGGGRSGALQRVTLRFEAAVLGRVDLALELVPGAASATVHAPAGAAAHRLAEHADELRAALAQATGRPATVSVRQREETVDLRA